MRRNAVVRASLKKLRMCHSQRRDHITKTNSVAKVLHVMGLTSVAARPLESKKQNEHIKITDEQNQFATLKP
eukprot:5953744-Amphidinium_carterae.1